MMVLPGSLDDLVARAGKRPIYCTAPGGVRRALMAIAIESFRLEFPDAAFINALTLYRHSDDRRSRWPRERERYGAAIVVTRADSSAENSELFDKPSGEHALDAWVALEIDDFAHFGRPVAWHAIEFPASYWFSRFVVEPFEWIATSRWARVLPAADGELFSPKIGSPFATNTDALETLSRSLAQTAG
jgi:hypothetical protein